MMLRWVEHNGDETLLAKLRTTTAAVAHPKPKEGSETVVADLVLDGMGKPSTEKFNGDVHAARWDVLCTWLAITPPPAIVIHGAQRLRLPSIKSLVAAAGDADIDVWLVIDEHGSPGLERWLASEAHRTEVDVLLSSLETVKPKSVITSGPELVPRRDFTTFWAACRDQLDASTFASVDARYWAAWDAAASLVIAGGTDADIHSLLAQLLDDSGSMLDCVTVVRAVQAAAFVHRVFVQVRIDQLLGVTVQMPRRALRTPEVWARLLRWRHPVRSAICALVAAGATPAELLDISVSDARADVVTVAGRPLHIEPEAQVFLRALLHWRQLVGADAAAPLLISPNGDAMNENYVIRTLSAARLHLGIPVVEDRQRRQARSAAWYDQAGISVYRPKSEGPCSTAA
jgi:hypothetical protein